MSTALELEALPRDVTPEEVARVPFREWVRRCADILLEHGRDRYGAEPTPQFVSILDARDRTCPREPLPLDEIFRVQRRGRRNPAGANLNCDHSLLRSLQALSVIFSDGRYALAARKHAAWTMEHLIDEHGMFWWGWHRHFDLFTRQRDGHDGNPHELHAIEEHAWEILWRENPAAVRREIEGIWTWHVIDKATGELNRHADGNKGCDFSMTAGALIHAFAFLAQVSSETIWRDRARLISSYYWERRNPETNLIPERPNAGSNRFDGSCSPTTVPGPYCRGLLSAYTLTGDNVLRQRALAHLRAYAHYGYDARTGKFWGALRLDGSPVLEGKTDVATGDLSRGDYSLFEPRGHTDLWQPYVAGYENPLVAAQCYAHAHALTGEADMLETAERWAAWIASTLPAGRCERPHAWYAPYAETMAIHGTYAWHYARAISLFTQLFALTANTEHLDHARAVAVDAISRLHHRGLLRGHPAKPYYEAVDGVGSLMQALLALDRVIADPRGCAVSRSALLAGAGGPELPLMSW